MKPLSHQQHDLPGKLIVFSGVDGAGKTTLLEAARRSLQDRGIDTLVTKMPSHRVRSIDVFRNVVEGKVDAGPTVDLFTLTVLASGDRLIVQETEIAPALARGKWVLCDRYAYTGLVCSDDPIIVALSERLYEPDLAVLVDASTKTVRERIRERPEERDRFFDDAEVTRKIERFREIQEANDFFVRIDTEQPIEMAFKELQIHLEHLIGIDPGAIERTTRTLSKPRSTPRLP